MFVQRVAELIFEQAYCLRRKTSQQSLRRLLKLRSMSTSEIALLSDNCKIRHKSPNVCTGFLDRAKQNLDSMKKWNGLVGFSIPCRREGACGNIAAYYGCPERRIRLSKSDVTNPRIESYTVTISYLTRTSVPRIVDISRRRRRSRHIPSHVFRVVRHPVQPRIWNYTSQRPQYVISKRFQANQ